MSAAGALSLSLALPLALPSPLEPLDLRWLWGEEGPAVWVKRDDLIHPEVSGNKWRKLAGVFERGAGESGRAPRLITFGGARSNHLVAASAAAAAAGWGLTCVVRGEELAARPLSPHLARCAALGARLAFVSRARFAALREGGWALTPEERAAWAPPGGGGAVEVLPEGGAGAHVASGCAGLWAELEAQWGEEKRGEEKRGDERRGAALCGPPDELWLAAGTGATARGVAAAMPPGHPTRLVAVSAARGARREEEALLAVAAARGVAAEGVDEERFGGFARGLEAARAWARRVEERAGVWVDPVYNAKLLAELAARAPRLAGRRVVWVHSGGWRGEGGGAGDC